MSTKDLFVSIRKRKLHIFVRRHRTVIGRGKLIVSLDIAEQDHFKAVVRIKCSSHGGIPAVFCNGFQHTACSPDKLPYMIRSISVIPAFHL